jgi:hypothetical protein
MFCRFAPFLAFCGWRYRNYEHTTHTMGQQSQQQKSARSFFVLLLLPEISEGSIDPIVRVSHKCKPA